MRTSTRIAATVASAGLIAAAMAAPASAARPDWSKKSDSSIVETAIAISGAPGTREEPAFDSNAGDFDILIEALLATGVASIFDGTDYTVFAPTDGAFRATFGGASEAEVFQRTVAAAATVGGVPKVLAYHVTEGVRNSNSVTKARKITMLNGGTISARGGFVDAAKTDAAFVPGLINIRVSDGMIHVIDKVLVP